MTRKELLCSIKTLRRENYSYQFIGDTLGIPMNTVKSICRRYGYKAEGARKTKVEKKNAPLCKYCRKPITDGRKDRTFCSEECRTKWWREQKKVIEIRS